MPIELSGVQILIILAVALLIFGPRRLPTLGRSLGSGLREFRDGMRRIASPMEPASPEGPPAPTAAPAGRPDGEAPSGR